MSKSSSLLFWADWNYLSHLTTDNLGNISRLVLQQSSVSHSVVSNSLWPHGLYVAHQPPLSMEFSRQGSWSGLPFPSPEDLPDPGIKPRSPALQADSLPSEPPGKPVLQQRTSTNISTSFINPYLSKYLFDFSHYLPHLSTNHFPCELQSLPLCFYNHRRQ